MTFISKSKSNIWMTEYLSQGEIYRSLVSEIIYQGKSKYQNISIVKLINESKAFYLDNQLQSTTADEFMYHETLVHVPFISHQNPENILIIGGGEGASAREALKWKSVKKITLIEIDEDVILFCNKYLPEMCLGSYDNSKVKIEIYDARFYLKNTQEKYDVIICDLCDQNFDSNNIINSEFLYNCKNSLRENGNICIQSGEMPFKWNILFHQYIEMLKSIFNSVNLFTAWIPSYCRSWAFVLLSDNKSNNISADVVRKILQEKIGSDLLFINEQAYIGIFNPAKYIQEYENKKRIV